MCMSVLQRFATFRYTQRTTLKAENLISVWHVILFRKCMYNISIIVFLLYLYAAFIRKKAKMLISISVVCEIISLTRNLSGDGIPNVTQVLLQVHNRSISLPGLRLTPRRRGYSRTISEKFWTDDKRRLRYKMGKKYCRKFQPLRTLQTTDGFAVAKTKTRT